MGRTQNIAVIGRGMIGSAAAKYLAEAGYDVSLIGTPEPPSYRDHDGVFSSHYDSGRITRGLDASAFWSGVSRASIARYRDIEAATGIRFYEEVGLLMSGLEDGQGQIGNVCKVAENAGLACEYLRSTELERRFPYFAFPKGTLGIYESKEAGYINPREMVRAQIVLAQKSGASFIDGEVLGIEDHAQGVRVRLAEESLTFDKVLVATGGFTQALMGDRLALTTYARTVALFPIDAAEQARLAGMPSHIALPEDGRDPYLLPPILYPDGKTYVKLGGDPDDIVLETTQDVKDWFRGGGSDQVGAFLEDEIRQRIPGLAAGPRVVLPCVTTFTKDNLPVIEALSDRVAVAVGGNGKGAKNSDELGRLGAEAVAGCPLP